MRRVFSATPGGIAEIYREFESDSLYFIPARTLLGREIHRQEQRRRLGWESEFSLKHSYTSANGDELHISGRADLVCRTPDATQIVELKSVAMAPLQFSNIIEAPQSFVVQTVIYAYLLSELFHTPPALVHPKLLCINIADNGRREWTLSWETSQVEDYFERYIGERRGAEAQRLREQRRRASLSKKIVFPLNQIRPAQQLIVESIEMALPENGDVLIDAPPGSGKTLAVLTSALKVALGNGSQLFYATAKGGGRNPIRKAVEQISPSSPLLSVVFLASQREICDTAQGNPTCRRCTADFKENAGDHSELPSILKDGGVFDTAKLCDLANQHGCCAVDLAHSTASQADLLVGDYNFLFDPGAKLKIFRQDESLNWYLAGDEAHNLPSRMRTNLSSEIKLAELERLWSFVTDDLWRFNDLNAIEDLRLSFKNIKEWLEVQIQQGDPGATVEVEFSLNEIEILSETFATTSGIVLAAVAQRIYDEARQALYEILASIRHFARIAKLERGRYIHFVEFDGGIIGIKCLDPSQEIAEVLNQLRGFVLFSGTLSPIDQFRREIGEPARPYVELNIGRDLACDDRLLVLNAPGIDTFKRLRDQTARKVARAIENFSSLSPGSILVVFPSYEYLYNISAILVSTKLTVLIQKPDMTFAERIEFKRSFGNSAGKMVGLVVAGGQFSEAEDYPGEACVGVAIVGPCLPPADPWKEALAAYWYDNGYDGRAAVYLIPAVKKVVQSAGRMLRLDSDRGIVLLIDDRFGRDPILSLLPTAWQDMILNHHSDWEVAAKEFWENQNK